MMERVKVECPNCRHITNTSKAIGEIYYCTNRDCKKAYVMAKNLIVS